MSDVLTREEWRSHSIHLGIAPSAEEKDEHRNALLAHDAALRARADAAEAKLKKAEEERDDPCPWCHGRRQDFRALDQGYGEEDIDINRCPSTKWEGGRLTHHCHERCERVAAESRVAALTEIIEKAPHAILCAAAPNVLRRHGHRFVCNCWKRAALEREEKK